MKNKTLIILGILSFVNNITFSQCNSPINFPPSNANGLGGTFCLLGSPTVNNNICFENNLGDLNLLFSGNLLGGNPNLFKFSKTGDFSMGDKYVQSSQLTIVGANATNTDFNSPLNKRDISFEFLSAGSTKIRSFRGTNMDTYIQLLTNPRKRNGTDSPINDPIVRMHINDNGFIGIGTISPTQQLHVKENIKLEGSFIKFAPGGDAIINRETKGNLMLNANGDDNAVFINYKGDNNNSYESNAYGGLKLFDGGNVNFANFWITRGELVTTNAIEKEAGNLVISPSGGRVIIADKTNTGLSMPNPGNYKLIVQNGILTTKIKVAVQNATNWSDHVFEDKYKLKQLRDVEKYIKENKHLPNIPSSDELVRDGMDLGEMQAKQMEKIEELTLYMIEMKKEIEELKKENKELKEKVSNSKN